MENGPKLWKAILKEMPHHSIIAGGAVRDYLLGVPPKDIDVFCPSYVLGNFDFGPFEPLGGDRDDEYAVMSMVDIVQRRQMFGFQVDLVGVCIPDWSPSALVQTFDFGITRSWFEGDELHDTAEAGFDRANKTVTRLVVGRDERAKIRFDRFNDRMGGGWTYEAQP